MAEVGLHTPLLVIGKQPVNIGGIFPTAQSLTMVTGSIGLRRGAQNWMAKGLVYLAFNYGLSLGVSSCGLLRLWESAVLVGTW